MFAKKTLRAGLALALTLFMSVQNAGYAVSAAAGDYDLDIDPSYKTFPNASEGYREQDIERFFVTNTGTETVTGLKAELYDGEAFEITNGGVSDSSLEPDEETTVRVRPKTGLNEKSSAYTDELVITGDNGVHETVRLSFTVNDPDDYDLYELTIEAERGGWVNDSREGDYEEGDTVDISARADSDYEFDRWTSSDGGEFDNRYREDTTFTMPDEHTTVTAHFILDDEYYDYDDYYYDDDYYYGDAYVSPDNIYFEKNRDSDVEIRLYRDGYSLRRLRYGNFTLVRGEDYTVRGSVYTLSSEFLSTLPVGTHTVTFIMTGGYDPTLVIEAADEKNYIVPPAVQVPKAEFVPTSTVSPSPAPSNVYAPQPPPVYTPAATPTPVPSAVETPQNPAPASPVTETPAAEYQLLTALLNGSAFNPAGTQPILKDGIPMLPVRAVFEQLGYTLAWDESQQTATITRGGTVIVLTENSYSFALNGFPEQLNTPVQRVNGALMMPMAEVLQSVGGIVYLDENMRIQIFITRQ